MSFIDYGQTAEDHQSLLVLVRHTGTHITNHTFLPAWERVRKINCIHVEGQKRNVFVRYKRTYPVENNTWGDFQTHRKVLGLVSIGKCSTSAEFEALFEDYKKMKENYANTIYNSRLIVFGMNTDGTPFLNENTNLNSSSKPELLNDKNDNVTNEMQMSQNGDIKKENKKIEQKETLQRTHSNSLTKESTGAEVVFYPDLDSAKDLEERLREFVTSLFYVLEGKRLDRSFERADRLQLLCAPSEVKDFVGVDTDTRSFKKKCTGRLRKHLADLCLQAGMPGEAILHYQTAIDLLRNVNDFLWIGGCYEGLSSSSVIMAHPKISAAASIKRNLSFTDKRMAAINLDKNKAATLTNSFANGLDLADIPNGPGLNPEDIIEKYREAITHYSKFKTAGKIEMEASLKACRVLIGQRKYLQASDFLQNVVYIDLKVSEEDKIQRFGTLATLYTQIGFHRKAGFFKRIAGMQCVAPQTSAWQQCYQLLLQTLQGYKIFLETRNTQTTGSDSNKGWPTLRHRILTELVYAARRMGNPQLAVRHMSFLLHTMFEHLSTAERREAVTGLMSLTSKCEGSAQSIALDNGQILPPVPLTKFPLVKSFTIMNLPPHLQPIEKNTDPNKKPDVFIFTPIQQTDKDSNSLQSKVSFVWVKDEICEVELYVVNPLPDELRISYMALLTEGVEVEVFPSNPSIPAESKTSLVKLQCKPKSIGDLKIIGYTTHVLGVNSKCYLKHLHHLEKKPMTVEVVPALPQVTLRSSLPKAANFSSLGDGLNVVANSSISVFAGQSQECTISLENVGKIPVTGVAVSVNSKPEVKEFVDNVLSWSSENINSQLPLSPMTTLCFSVCFYGYSDFLSPESASSELPSPAYSNRSRSDSSENKVYEVLLNIDYRQCKEYSRQCSMVVSLDILPSVYIVNWDVQHSESCDKCVVILDLQNVSNHEMEVEYCVNKKLVIEPQQCRRIAIEIHRVEFPPELDNQEELVSPNLPVWSSVKKVNHFSSYLSNFIDIRWSMSSTKVSGKVCIDYLTWSRSQLEILQLPAVRWEVRLNDQLFLSPDVPKFTTGKIIQVKATIFNDAGGDCRDVRLSVYPNQCVEGAGGTTVPVSPNNTDILSVIDSHSIFYKLLSDKDCAVIVCAFIFFCPGLFTFDISCCHSNKDLDIQTWRCFPRPQVVIVD